ncbi:nickel transporter permease [Methanocalculus taiwanensis]|nr:nickel transporter permease [Methanocalculus taiwanensis]
MTETNFLLAEFCRNRLALIGAVIIGIIVLCAIFAPLIAPFDPAEQNLRERLQTPSIQHPFGTDDLGRDIFSRVVFGSRISLSIGICVVGITALFGTILGLLSGYGGRAIDEVIMRFVDIMLAFPSIILALIIAGLLGPGVVNVIIALSLTQWPAYTRLVRGMTLSMKEKEFVEAARALGASDTYILRKHILLNASNPIIVLATMDIAQTIIFAAALSFLGLGIQPPTPEWGSMLKAGIPYLRSATYITFFPGILLMLTVLAFNFIGDGIRDTLDPHTKEMTLVK